MKFFFPVVFNLLLTTDFEHCRKFILYSSMGKGAPHSNSNSLPTALVPHAQIPHHVLVPSPIFPTTCWSPHPNFPPLTGTLTQIPHHLLVPSLKFPTTCWSPHPNSPPLAGPLTQIPHHLLVPSFKFPTTCWSPHSNSPPPAGPLTQIPHHLLVPL